MLRATIAGVPRPIREPIGVQLTRTARSVSSAFDDSLAAAGGSIPVWLVLIGLKTQQPDTQRQLADAIGIREATLTHHLNAMEAAGLVVRGRDPDNRRVHRLALTDAGEATFHRLREAVAAFDSRLRSGLDEAKLTSLRRALDRLQANAAEPADPAVRTGVRIRP